MKISQTGLNLIKSYEGCQLTAYKAVSTEKYYTIGYGHYGADVKKGMKITQAQADAYLVSDLSKFETKVNKYQTKYNFNQNQFDALVSFAYNVGSIDGLTANGTRTIAQISSKFAAYNKSGGRVLTGLTKRRAAEKKLFDTAVKSSFFYEGVNMSPVFDASYYASRYPDVKAVYGTNAAQLFNHFKEYGMKEGRQAIDTFNVAVYKARYTDLQKAFGNNLPAYYKHYCTNGKSEGRTAI